MKDSLLINRHIAEYLSSLEPDLPDFLEKLYQKARENRVPVIRREAQSLLRFLCLDRKPGRVLEIGTAIGFSSCFTAEFMPKGSVLFTVENYEPRYTEAQENIAAYREDYLARKGYESPEIRSVFSDAEEYLKELCGKCETFDLIFLDAAKAQYPAYLGHIKKLMAPGAILLTDNLLQEGTLAESKFTVERRDRTIHLRIREFADMLFRSGEFDSVMLPLGDGMCITRLKDSDSYPVNTGEGCQS